MATRAEIDEAAKGRTICSVFLDTVSAHGTRIAVREGVDPGGGRAATYGELGAQVARAAAGLRALGLRPGERVLLMVDNGIAFRVADLAVLFAGGTPISLYDTSSKEQVTWLASHSRAAFAIVQGDAQLERFQAVSPRSGDAPGATPAAAGLPDHALRQLVVIEPPAEAGEPLTRWDDLLSASPLDLATAAGEVASDDLATVIYTSGTTGPPKGVMITHANVVWTIESQARAFGRRAPGYRTLSYLPMAHIAERLVSYYEAVDGGYDVTCCPDVSLLGRYVVGVRPEFLFGVPRVWEKLKAGAEAALAADPSRAAAFIPALEAALPLRLAAIEGTLGPDAEQALARLDDAAFAKLRAGLGLDRCELPITSAAPIPRAVLEWYIAIGVPILEVYGMSEATGPITSNIESRRPGTVGRAAPGCELVLADDGEVLVRGGNVFAGYLDDPALTAETVDADGWLHTGDVGVLDGDGRLRIVDRKKELFITAGGENISPANLEAALKSIPLVGQAIAVGDGRPYPAALLVLDPDAAGTWARAHHREGASPAELAADPDLLGEIEAGLDLVMAPFGRAERVKRFAVLGDEWQPDSDELTATLKLKRRAVLAKYAAEIDTLYD